MCKDKEIKINVEDFLFLFSKFCRDWDDVIYEAHPELKSHRFSVANHLFITYLEKVFGSFENIQSQLYDNFNEFEFVKKIMKENEICGYNEISY